MKDFTDNHLIFFYSLKFISVDNRKLLLVVVFTSDDANTQFHGSSLFLDDFPGDDDALNFRCAFIDGCGARIAV
jgi:hypothetical protein